MFLSIVGLRIPNAICVCDQNNANFVLVTNCGNTISRCELLVLRVITDQLSIRLRNRVLLSLAGTDNWLSPCLLLDSSVSALHEQSG